MNTLKKISTLAIFLTSASTNAATLNASAIISGTNNVIGQGFVTVNETFSDSSPAASTSNVSINQGASFRGINQTGTFLGSVNVDGSDNGDFSLSVVGQGNHTVESIFQFSELITNASATTESLSMDFLISSGILSARAFEVTQQGDEFLQAEYNVSISFGGTELFQSGAVLRQTAGTNNGTSSSSLQQTGVSLEGTYIPGGNLEFLNNDTSYSWDDYAGNLLLGSLNSGESKLLEYNVFVRGSGQFDLCGSSGCGITRARIGDPFSFSSNISPDNISAVPVPAAVWLFGSGLLCVVGAARRNV